MPGTVDIEVALEAVGEMLVTIAGLGVGQGRAPLPPDGADDPELPYVIVYSIPWDFYDFLPMSSDQDVPLAFQTTTVGATAQQARFNDDRIRAKLTEISPVTGTWVTPLVIPGMTVMGRRCTMAGGEDPDVRLTSVVSRYVLDVSTRT